MNKRGQTNTTVGGLLVAIFLFAIVVISGFTFYLGSLVDNEVSLPDGINQTNIYASFDRYEQNLSTVADQIDEDKSQVPLIGGLIDFFATGVDSIKTGWISVAFVKEYINFARQNTVLGQFLPDTFWGMVGSILIIVIILIVLGALWKYQLTK